MRRMLLEELQRARMDKVPVALVTDLDDGTQGLVYGDHLAAAELPLGSSVTEEIRDMLRAARSGMLAGSELFVRSYVAPYRLFIIGAVHIAQALATLAQECGYQVTAQWPDEAMARLAPDAQTAVVTLAHDPKIDDPALIAALNSEAFYIGALGSRRTHGKRVERLTDIGLGDKLERINAPIGLDLGGRSHAEIAVAILAQLIQARYNG